MTWSDTGLNGMSHIFHELYRSRLAHGVWRDKVCPILINNWEATYFDFDEDKLVRIASKAQEAGVELFVLDDGWFSTRRDDYHGLGDWTPNKELLPNGITGLAQINGRDLTSSADKIRWDVEYVHKFGPAMDLKILLSTIPQVFRGRDVVEGGKKVK